MPKKQKSTAALIARLSPPSWLSNEGKIIFRELEEVLSPMGVLTVADSSALELLADSLAQYKECRQFIMDHGTTYETVNENGTVLTRTYPQVALAAEAWKRAKSMLIEFGLTPSARGKLKIEKQEEPFCFEGFTGFEEI